MLPDRIQIIGEGNVAFHLASGICCIPEVKKIRILSRNKNHSQLFQDLSDKVESDYISNFDFTHPLTIIAVSDDAVKSIADQVKGYENLLVHTSGSNDIEFFKKLGFINYGALYPLQTFSIKKEILWPEVPVFITTNTIDNDEYLIHFSRQLSLEVQTISDDQRISIHIAAILVNNFTNQLFTLADDWLTKNKLNFNILKPLISETINKLNILDPSEAQTGPAIRQDLNIIDKHRRRLSHEPELLKIYELMTESIITSHKQHNRK